MSSQYSLQYLLIALLVLIQGAEQKKAREMAEKMTLTAYLAQRGVKAKALTRGEATLLGIPFPLQRGWARKHGGMKIDGALLPRLTAYADAARQAAEEKVRAKMAEPHPIAPVYAQLQLVAAPARIPASPVPGFVLRRAKRFSKAVPWA